MHFFELRVSVRRLVTVKDNGLLGSHRGGFILSRFADGRLKKHKGCTASISKIRSCRTVRRIDVAGDIPNGGSICLKNTG
jgi:hypothetical protein